MLLTIATTHQPATDLGYLLHKHPNRCQSFSLSFGEAHIFYRAGKLRHKDRRFEWTRSELQNWANQIGENFSYKVEFKSVGEEDLEVGSPTQMAIFSINS